MASLREIAMAEAASILCYTPKSRGEPLDGRLLVVPVEVGGEISTLEFIDESGRKSALYGGSKAGGYWAAQPLPEGDGAGSVLLIGEGVATALSAREATGHLALAALPCGNLLSVAKAMRDRYPAAEIVVLADLVKATGEPDPHAVEAARAVGGRLAVPDFGDDRPEGAADFNDLVALRGREVAAECIRGQTSSKHGVPGVPDVEASPGAGSSRNTRKNCGVPGVPEPADRPCFRVFDEWIEHPTGKLRPGVWHFGIKPGRKAEDPSILTQQWVCTPLDIIAVTFDQQSNNFGRLLRFRNTLGGWREWAMPMDLLRGYGDELRGELLAMGVEIDPLSKNLLGQYLQSVHPETRVRCALQVGWCGDSFVLPDDVIGSGASGVIFQSGERRHDEYTRAGTLDGWQSRVAARAAGNSLLVQTLSASFAGPCLGFSIWRVEGSISLTTRVRGKLRPS